MGTRRTSLTAFALVAIASLLAACQSVPPPAAVRSGFSSEQVAVLQEKGFRQVGENYELGLSNRVLFDFDSSALQQSSIGMLRELAGVLVDIGIGGATLEGHTDALGEQDYNLSLSVERATAVRAVMVESGMSGNRVRVVGLGESDPIESNDTEEGRQQNRRVVIVVSPMDALAL